ncbi:hypothetical protein DUI87_17956 [Hirundo rustica rustica]|uniref:Uncharacterized protein n=1 Tax=Hirundo rustica rustica TaxID=333673 RepID=A0A3M0K083_HIRRU|nr:hypothetical protein DUI87_17956 [Hirundo rustica rustica]
MKLLKYMGYSRAKDGEGNGNDGKHMGDPLRIIGAKCITAKEFTISLWKRYLPTAHQEEVYLIVGDTQTMTWEIPELTAVGGWDMNILCPGYYHIPPVVQPSNLQVNKYIIAEDRVIHEEAEIFSRFPPCSTEAIVTLGKQLSVPKLAQMQISMWLVPELSPEASPPPLVSLAWATGGSTLELSGIGSVRHGGSCRQLLLTKVTSVGLHHQNLAKQTRHKPVEEFGNKFYNGVVNELGPRQKSDESNW